MYINSTLRKSAQALTLSVFCLMLLALYVTQINRYSPVSAQEETTWRMTRFGWEDAAAWDRPSSPKFERRIELIHPVIFSAVIAFSSMAVLIWATEEYDWGRLTQKRELTIREKLTQLENAKSGSV